MNGHILPTAQQLLSQGNGHQQVKPGRPVRVHEIQASFESEGRNAQAVVEGHRLRSGDLALTVYVFVGGATFAASIRDLCRARVGVAWVRIMRRQSSGRFSGKESQANMEVIIGHQSPAPEPGFDVLALIKLADASRCGGATAESSESEEEIVIDMSFQIFIKYYNGKTYTFTVYAETLVKELMQMVQKKLGIHPDQQRLLFSGKQLEPGRPLSFFGIKADSTLNLVGRLRGG